MRLTLLTSLLGLALAGMASAHTSADLLNHGCSLEKRQEMMAARLAKRQFTNSGGEGQAVGNSGGASAANYKCDPNTCKLPKCHCADTKPPGGLDPKQVPQFIVFTADDAVQSYTINSVNQFLAQRKNPNGCPPKMTYYVSLQYTNYSMVTRLYVEGNEVADHTITHVNQAPVEEIDGNIIGLNALAGIPYRSIQGYRAPFLNYTKANLEHLAKAGFLYDSSTTSSVPVTDPNTDAFWPYTLDNGLANDCAFVPDVCHGEPKLPGFWEVPMYSIFDERGAAGAHLMDPYLDSTNPNDVLNWMKNTFTDHYNGNRQPFGLYFHPIHLATNFPNLADPVELIKMVNQFLDWATTSPNMQDVWIVSNAQLLAWMQNPVPASQLNTLDAFKCQKPNVPEKICNGFPENDNLLEHCFSETPGDSLNNSPFYTCYGCPTTTPSPQQPNPPQKNNDGTVRTRINNECDTPWWDPVKGKCLCSGSSCAFTDSTRSIGPNGGNLTSSGGQNLAGASGSSTASTDPYRNFNGALGSFNGIGMAGWAVTTLAGVIAGVAMVMA